MTAGFTTNGNANVHKTSQCWGCGAVIFFDGKTVNPTTGKLQRFDAETKQVHHCDPAVRAEYQAKKEMQEAQSQTQRIIAVAPQQQLPEETSSITVTPCKYPQHRVKLIGEGLQELEDHINAGLAANDEAGYLHRGVTILLPADKTAACIHYEILQPRQERK